MSPYVSVYVARAFCHQSKGGNAAGVVLMDNEVAYTNEQMQSIATRLNFSETIFISSLPNRVYRALYFTPTSSIDFCGHATLAAFGVLKVLRSLKDGVYTLDTLKGLCDVTLKDELVYLSQPLPTFGKAVDQDEIRAILGNCLMDPSPSIVSTGLADIFVRVKDEQSLNQIQPDFEQMVKFNKKTETIGMHVFALNAPGSEITAYCRNFAPLFGIPEESATGSSNGALICYLFKNGLLPSSSEHFLLFRQGESLKAPSDIYVHLKTRDCVIEKVECAGEVVVDEERKLQVL